MLKKHSHWKMGSLFILLSLSGCSLLPQQSPIEPWEKGHLAKPEMQWQTDALRARFLQQTYFSKEASSGQTENAGGGCGCNQ